MQTPKPRCLAAVLDSSGLGPMRSRQISHLSRPPDEAEELPYLLRDDFFSDAETSFFHLLEYALADKYAIFPKVSLSEIFFVSRPYINLSHYNKINRKHVDFLLCEPSSIRPMLAPSSSMMPATCAKTG